MRSWQGIRAAGFAALVGLAVVMVGPSLAVAAAEEDGAPVNAGEVRLTKEQSDLIELKTAAAKPGAVTVDLVLNGEVTANQDRTVTVLPRTAGVVREVPKRLGERVRAGETLAFIESREIAEAQAAYLTARSKAALAQNRLAREESLWKKKITSEQEYLAAKQAATEATIEVSAAERKLALLGVDPKTVSEAAPGKSGSVVRVHVTAPFDGTLIEKKVAVGDQVSPDTPLFRLANLETVWVIGSVFEKDMGRVALGQTASVTLKAYPDRRFDGPVTWISDVLDEKTRTLRIRVELANPERLLKPGSFARVAIKIASKQEALVVPPAAVQRQKDETIVFVDAGDGLFKRREVKIGTRSPQAVEILEGLDAGETVVTDGSFLLKAELEKSSFAEAD